RARELLADHERRRDRGVEALRRRPRQRAARLLVDGAGLELGVAQRVVARAQDLAQRLAVGAHRQRDLQRALEELGRDLRLVGLRVRAAGQERDGRVAGALALQRAPDRIGVAAAAG